MIDPMSYYVQHLPPVPQAATPAASQTTTNSPQQEIHKKAKPKQKAQPKKQSVFRIGIGAASLAFGSTAFAVILLVWLGWVFYVLNFSGILQWW
jgi:hypothetical protein